MDDSYDFVVIGGGSAGYAGASTAASLGLRTVVVEGGSEVGGLCILRGCMPSKTLIESGHRAEAIRHAVEFGLRARYEGFDPAAIRARKRTLITEFADYRRGQLSDGRFDFIRGLARFTDAHTIEIELRDGGTRLISGKTFLIATGSVINVPEVEGLKETGFWTSDDVLDAGEVPSSVCVLGGGAIALELASFYAGLGIPTEVIQRSPQVLREVDEDVAEALVVALTKRGIRVHRDTTLQRVQRGADGLKEVVFHDGAGREHVARAAEIICALGRRPAIGDLGLEHLGVRLDRGCLVSELTQRSTVHHVFAAGDVCSPVEVVHVAVEQGTLAARNAARLLGKLDGPPEKMDYRLKLFAVFTKPQVASVGLSEWECREQGLEFAAASYPFADHGKSMVQGETDGFVKLIADKKTGKILGGACIGPEASELIHEIVVAMRFEATAHQLATTPHYHPTLSEIWTYPAEELAG